MTTLKLAGVEVPRVGLGTNRLTPENVDFVTAAVAAGVKHIDTARLYQGGRSEEAIGLAGVPDDVLVATKGGYADAGGGRPEVLNAEIEASLKALKTDAIGLYYLHKIDPETPLEESLGTISEHVDKGDIRHVGISNASQEQVERARKVVDIAAVQNHYNLATRGDDALIDHLAEAGIVYVPYFPLRDDVSAAVQGVADRLGATPNQVKLAWLVRRAPNVLPIPGTLNADHYAENLAALDLELTDEDVAAIGG